MCFCCIPGMWLMRPLLPHAVLSPPSPPVRKQERVELLLGCLRYTRLCWVRKHVNATMKPTNSPTQGQPNPRKIRLKVAFWAAFSHRKYFFVGWDSFYIGGRLRETHPNQFLRKHPTATTTTAATIPLQ